MEGLFLLPVSKANGLSGVVLKGHFKKLGASFSFSRSAFSKMTTQLWLLGQVAFDL